MITYNGNEMMLQNDMGNTLIQDSATGNIMGLSPGFIPIGMKEHGGIMYIASVDKEGNGEIGTIPSPIIRDFYKDRVIFEVGQSIPINSGDPIQISNKLYPADKFIVNLQMEMEEDSESEIKGADVFHKVSPLSSDNSVDPSDFILKRRVVDINNELRYTDIYTPLISYSPDFTDSKVSLYECAEPVDLFSTKGIYKMSLLSTNTNGQKVENSLTNCQIYGDDGERSKYWFIHSDDPSGIFPKDLLTATLNSDLKQFPSSNKPGELTIKLETEQIGKFDILPRNDGLTVPITFKNYTDSVNYTTYFPGFYYSTDSGLYIDKLSNIRIIDESTNKDIFNTTDSVEFKNYNLENVSSISKTENGESIEVWTCKQWPQTKTSDEKSPNTFILSNIKSIIKHNETNLRSSAQNIDESPHDGVIQVNLGTKYNNWYRLELDYYDQYDEKQGMFTKRFNPYINDVFGTNLNTSGVEMSEDFTIGKQLQIIQEQQTFENIQYPIFNVTRPEHRRPGANADLEWYHATSLTQSVYNKVQLLSDTLKPITFTDISYPGKLFEQYGGEKLLYIYKNIPYQDELTYSISGAWIGPVSNIARLCVSDYKIQKIYVNGSHTSHNLNEETWTGVVSLNDVVDGDSVIFSSAHMGEAWGSDVYLPIVDGYPVTNSESKFKQDNIFNTNININSRLNNSQLSCDILIDEAQNIKISEFKWLGSEDFKVWYFRYTDQDYKDLDEYWQLKCPIKVTAKFDSYTKKLLPSYSITPYFCLTGTNDEGKKTYVSRFKKDINTELTYQCNFETDSFGDIQNYIINNSEKQEGNIVCSYNHSHPFMYNDTDVSETLMLQAGIYVLNIARCPGKTTLGDIGTYGPIINFTIVLDGITYKYSELTPEQLQESGFSNENTNRWVAQPALMFSNKTDKHRHIYKPLVLIVKSGQSVKLNIEGVKYIDGDGIELSKPKFIRQSIGLYKLKNTDKYKILQDLKFLNSNLYTYDEYMKKLNDSFKKLNDIEYYNQMQKYGIFFKSSYVFIDGLVSDDHNSINSIKVGGNTYNTYPYIPSDPSILPVELDSNYNYIWNAYAMPNGIITTPDDDHDFVFSNGVPPGISTSTKADYNNLRKPI